MPHDDSATDRLPLTGLKLCCTSIPPEQRAALASSAAEMGAVHSLDLTSDVTHLIVGRIDTPKYAYVARERPDIHVLHVDFLQAVKEKWMAGEDVRELLPEMEVQYKLPTFYGLRVCVTGFSDFEERGRLAETIQQCGGTYCGDLTKEVTHLVCKEPKGKKYEFAVQWRQKVVGPEWVWMSLERGMVLEESLFLPTMRVEERGVGAVKVVEVEERVELGKRGREGEGEGTGRRKMRRVATDTLSGRTENVWADIGGRDGGNPGEVESEDVTLVDEILPGVAPEADRRKSLFEVDALKGFSGKFIVYGFDQRKTDVLHNFLINNGGEVLEASDASADDNTAPIMIVVTHKATPEQQQQVQQLEMQLAFRCHVVNEWWVEKCLHQKELIDVQTPLCQPFNTFPIPGFEKLTICPSSFSGADLLHLSKAAPLMGAKYDETLRPTTSVLICNEAATLNREKLQYSTEKSIPIVSLPWFADCIAQGKVLPFAEYSISASRRVGSNQNLFWHPVHNTRPPPRRLVRDNGQTFRNRNGEMDASEMRREDPVKEKKSAEPLQEIQPEVNSPKKQSPAKLKPRKNMPFDDDEDDDEDDGFVHINHNEDDGDDLGVQTIPDDEDGQDEVEDSILKTFRDDEENSLTISERPLPTIPTMPLNPISNHARSVSVPQLDGASDPRPTQARLTTAITALLTSHKCKAARLLSRTTTASSDGGVISPVDSLDATAASAPTSEAAQPQPAIPLLRKHRTLGRAPSNPSTLLSRNVSGASNGSAASLPALHEHAQQRVEYEKDDLDALLHQHKQHDEDAGLFRPSQALSYEDPDAIASRKRVLESLGEEGRGEEGEVGKRRVEDIGVVKDRVRVVEENGKRGTRSRTGRRSGAK